MKTQPRRRTLVLSAAAAAGMSLLPARSVFAQDAAAPPRLDVPYVPTPQEVVDRMLDLADVGKNDVLYDLGCGDGRIVITAAKVRGARATGIDINPVRIAEATANAKKAGVEDRVTFKLGNLFEADVSPATVVTLYLLPSVNLKLRPRLWQQLKPGTRVVSHAFNMGPDWPPEETAQVAGRTIYYWTITEAQKRAAKP
ncbi:MAG: SAM-dependent methyltransferase [Massilia sp.]